MTDVNEHLSSGSKSDPHGVVIVSEIRVVRIALTSLLKSECPGTSIQPARTLSEARSIAAPSDVFLVDASTIRPDDRNQATSELASRLVVFGLTVEDPETVVRWAAVGATAYLLSESDLPEVVHALGGAYRHEFHCSPALAEVVVRQTPRIVLGMDHPRMTTLTKRESEIADLIDRGFSNKEIAKHMSISLSTVKNHVHSILKRLGARGRKQAATIAKRAIKGHLNGTET